MLLSVHFDWAVAQGLRRGCGRPARPSEKRRDSGDEFLRAERLRHVVVGAEFQPSHAIGFLGPRRHDDDGEGGGRRVRTQGPADFEAMHAGQHQVEDEEVRAPLSDARQRVGADGHRLGRVAGLDQVVADQFRDVAVVFDDEDVAHNRIRPLDPLSPAGLVSTADRAS